MENGKKAKAVRLEELDETLYLMRHLRGGLQVLYDACHDTPDYGYHELLQLSYLCEDRLEGFIVDADKIVKALEEAGAKDYDLYPTEKKTPCSTDEGKKQGASS